MPRNESSIRLRGVRQNNLKGFDLDLPIGKFIVVTGLSGTGKSSLVFDTLHAEGQRRYVETFSPYTRQFMELLPKPDCESIENIRPSIAIRQSNTVKTSRSTVGTMTELCDHFKVWFCHSATLHDPLSGKALKPETAQSIWKQCLSKYKDQELFLLFPVERKGKLPWCEIFSSLIKNGYTRALINGSYQRIDEIDTHSITVNKIHIVLDRVKIKSPSRRRFIEACETGLKHGNGWLSIANAEAKLHNTFCEGLRSPVNGEVFEPPKPALFSFNSPIGACSKCRGFGRIIEIDYDLVIPDDKLSIKEGAIRPFSGDTYGESLHDLIKLASKYNIPLEKPWKSLSRKQKNIVIEGDPKYGDGNDWPKAWYGVRRFFEYLIGKSYKMHVRVMLSKYRDYVTCPDCEGARLKSQALHWKWQHLTLPELYQIPVSELLQRMRKEFDRNGEQADTLNDPCQLALQNIIARLTYLDAVGLGYLTLDRSSRTLSGGEVERVNLTACLGSSLMETLFILDEPSVGLHPSDIHRLISILKALCIQGNTVVVVEHDEAIMHAADHIIELGPTPGEAGGNLVFSGTSKAFKNAKHSLTSAYMHKRKLVALPDSRRVRGTQSKASSKTKRPMLTLSGVSQNNIKDLNLSVPLNCFVAFCGVSGSGKSTLMRDLIYQSLMQAKPTGKHHLKSDIDFAEIVLVDQSPVTRTPRSNPALYANAWDAIREYFAKSEAAKAAGLTASHFSFNGGQGRCDHCQGLGYEKVEMQFLSEVYVPCPVCEGKRFKAEILEIERDGASIADVLDMDVSRAMSYFEGQVKIKSKLRSLESVGLGYLKLGQALNTLSGGESQRLKLVRYSHQIEESGKPALLLLDEPTTGLHRHDVARLLKVLQTLVDNGHSLIVVEHHMDVLAAADWLIELGPKAGTQGGQVVAEGTPEALSHKRSATAPFLKDSLNQDKSASAKPGHTTCEDKSTYVASNQAKPYIDIKGAREHNLKNINLRIPHGQTTVLTGVSGSGKSTLAFDIIFAEGQRRFMESISAYARQFVEQLSKPDIDQLSGITPTVAIEQRVTHGTRKSTVATITEVAQYLRLLFARLGIQHSPHNGQAVIPMSQDALTKRLGQLLKSQKRKHAYLCAPIIRGRKGHHQPLADWAASHGFTQLRCDGKMTATENFQRLDRYKEHDIEIVTAIFSQSSASKPSELRKHLKEALRLGKGSAIWIDGSSGAAHWLSASQTDPITGEAYPDLDPKHFSWNSPKGWCPSCNGYGKKVEIDEQGQIKHSHAEHETCPECNGARLNRLSRSVRLPLKSDKSVSLPELLKLCPEAILQVLHKLKLDTKSKAIAQDILPQIYERLSFLGRVGLEYLTLDRATSTLSGGEAQRIRLAAQLGSNLAGVTYVLDEPSIGLHARDNERLLGMLNDLKQRGNTLVLVEHDEDTMRQADQIIDLGPSAGIHGGEVIAQGPISKLLKHKQSLTAQYLKKGIEHPFRGAYRSLPRPWHARQKSNTDWLVLKQAALRNLKRIDLKLPLNRLCIVCGVSGAGKSTLIRDLLKPSVEAAIAHKKSKLDHSTILNIESFKHFTPSDAPLKELINGNGFQKVIEVDQSPIGKTPRSTPSTYIGAFDIIREYFASIPEARMHGHTAGTYSFNTKGGRCETCKGAGRVKLEMNFLPNTYVRCEDCGGTRYGPELEDIRWNHKSISEILDMSFEEAAPFFDFHVQLKDMMQLMVDTGLGYLKLGQSSPTLSGGEAQRVKLVSELAKGLPHLRDRKHGRQTHKLYILEEPTIGLHFADCERLIELLHRLVDQGHTVIVIEHHLDLIREADYVVELGPEGGDAGGELLYQGALKHFQTCKRSRTAKLL